MNAYRLSPLDELEAESLHVFREVVAEFERPALLYSMGKDSSVLLRLAEKAFTPAPPPFPVLFVDTTMKFPEAYAFRERVFANSPARPLVHTSADGQARGVNPFEFTTQQCCGVWKTRGLLDALTAHGIDAAFGGARRDEERSRNKERIFSFRDERGQWDPKRQRPELWNLYNTQRRGGETIRVFPLSNWTERDVWRYIEREQIEVAPLYFAREREVVERNGRLLPITPAFPPRAGEVVRRVWTRFRSIGCVPCSGVVTSHATTVAEILAELETTRSGERATRVIDYDQDGSMELKKREGYF